MKRTIAVIGADGRIGKSLPSSTDFVVFDVQWAADGKPILVGFDPLGKGQARHKQFLLDPKTGATTQLEKPVAFNPTEKPDVVTNSKLGLKLKRTTTSVKEGETARAVGSSLSPAPRELQLHAPAPNPAEAPGDVRFSLPAPGHVDIDLFNVAGQRVAQGASQWYPAGDHVVPLRGINESGRTLGSGVYFILLRGEGVNRTQNLIIAR